MRTFIGLTCIFIWAVIPNLAISQVPLDYRTEQVYLAPRSLSCLPGGSLLVDGIVTCIAADQIEPYSHYLYLELIGENDSVYVRQKLSCGDGGRFSTSISIDPELTKGIYYLRGYTRFMRSFSSSAFAIQPIAVGLDIKGTSECADDSINCVVATNGGYLLSDVLQRITAVMTSSLGLPIAGRHITLMDSDGDTIMTRTTSGSGYASFDFVPKKDKCYTVAYKSDSVVRHFSIPKTICDSVKIKSAVSGNKLRFELIGNSISKNYKLFSFDRNNGISEISTPEMSGIVRFTNSPTGPVTVFLTDSAMQVVSEHTVLPLLRNNVNLQSSDEATAGSNLDYSISGIDIKKNKVLARVIPDNAQWEIGGDEALLCASDYVGSLPFPRVRGSQNMRHEELSAWLETAKFNRFDFSKTVQNDTSTYEYLPEFVMGFIGSVFDDNKARHLINKGQVLAMDRESGYFYMTDILDNGQFGVIVDDFDEGTTFSLHTLGDKGKNIETMIVIEDDTFPAVEISPELKRLYATNQNIMVSDSIKESRALPEVTVKARLTRDKKKRDKAHYEVKMKDRDAIERRGYNTLLDILRDMPLITVAKIELENGDKVWRIFGSRGASTLRGDMDKGLALVIDGIKMDSESFDVLLETPAINIESVEQLSIGEALMTASNAFDGAISVKTRRHVPIKKEKSKGTVIMPMGLSNIKLNNFKKIRVPNKEGNYRLLVDVIGPDGVITLSRPLKVTTKK